MKLFKEQIRIPDNSWLYNQNEKRTFILIGKKYAGQDTTFRIESFSILEVFKAPEYAITLPYEDLEKLITNKTLEIIAKR